MKTAIVFISNHGTTEKVAKYISERMNVESIDFYNLRNKKEFNSAEYDNIIIGCSVHAGSIQSKMKKFLKSEESNLLQKNLGLFLCCMNEPEYESQFQSAYLESLRYHAKSHVIPGGEFLLDKMNFIEKAIVKKVAKTEKSISKIDYDKVDSFINEMF
jgi:menaquinone-dependent protoporphyrinogen oxidase